MAVVKVYCSRCGQRVSGDESFFGTTVQCPVCSSEIQFPESGPVPEEPSVLKADEENAEAPAWIESLPRAFAGPESSSPEEGDETGFTQTRPMPRHPGAPQSGPLPGDLPSAAANLPSAPEQAPMPSAGGEPQPGGAAISPERAREEGGDEEEEEDPGILPLLVLGSGIASVLLCSGFLILSAVAIISGHLAMIKLDSAGVREGRTKVLIGTLLGYCSVVFFLAAAVVIRLFWPTLRQWFENGGETAAWIATLGWC